MSPLIFCVRRTSTVLPTSLVFEEPFRTSKVDLLSVFISILISLHLAQGKKERERYMEAATSLLPSG
jgi:hypothetical protein